MTGFNGKVTNRSDGQKPKGFFRKLKGKFKGRTVKIEDTFQTKVPPLLPSKENRPKLNLNIDAQLANLKGELSQKTVSNREEASNLVKEIANQYQGLLKANEEKLQFLDVFAINRLIQSIKSCSDEKMPIFAFRNLMKESKAENSFAESLVQLSNEIKGVKVKKIAIKGENNPCAEQNKVIIAAAEEVNSSLNSYLNGRDIRFMSFTSIDENRKFCTTSESTNKCGISAKHSRLQYYLMIFAREFQRDLSTFNEEQKDFVNEIVAITKKDFEKPGVSEEFSDLVKAKRSQAEKLGLLHVLAEDYRKSLQTIRQGNNREMELLHWERMGSKFTSRL